MESIALIEKQETHFSSYTALSGTVWEQKPNEESKVDNHEGDSRLLADVNARQSRE
jgi:hypothetical protein